MRGTITEAQAKGQVPRCTRGTLGTGIDPKLWERPGARTLQDPVPLEVNDLYELELENSPDNFQGEKSKTLL